MPWVRFDDKFPEHPKVLALNDNHAELLHLHAIMYSNRNMTDGLIPAAALGRLIAHRSPRQLAQKLVAAGLWHEVEVGYEIHDYLHFQPSREWIMNERDAGKKRAAKSYEQRNSSEILRPKNPDSSGILRPTQPQPQTQVPKGSTDTSTTSTGVGAAAVELYVHADMATRSVTSIRNARSYRRQVADNAIRQHGDAISAYLERYPAATPLDIAVEVLGIDAYDARQAWTELHPEETA